MRIERVSKLGPWLHHFGVLDQHYNFMPIGDIQAIPTHFQNGNVVPHLLNSATNVLIDALNECPSSFPAPLFRYKPSGSSNDLLEFSITCEDKESGPGQIYGIGINLLKSLKSNLGRCF